MSFALHKKEAKLLPPDTFLSRKNAFAAGASPRTLLGELTALPHIPWRLMGEGPPGRGSERDRRGREGERRRGKGSGRVGGEGLSPSERKSSPSTIAESET